MKGAAKMKKLQETARDDTSRIYSKTRNNIETRTQTAVSQIAHRIFSGDGWTTAVTLDDAFAPELLQTWSLQDEGAKDAEKAETNAPIVDPDDAPLNC
jgi:hypothetical protein